MKKSNTQSELPGPSFALGGVTRRFGEIGTIRPLGPSSQVGCIQYQVWKRDPIGIIPNSTSTKRFLPTSCVYIYILYPLYLGLQKIQNFWPTLSATFCWMLIQTGDVLATSPKKRSWTLCPVDADDLSLSASLRWSARWCTMFELASMSMLLPKTSSGENYAINKREERSNFPILWHRDIQKSFGIFFGICSHLMVFVGVLMGFEGVLKVVVGANFRTKHVMAQHFTPSPELFIVMDWPSQDTCWYLHWHLHSHRSGRFLLLHP